MIINMIRGNRSREHVRGEVDFIDQLEKFESEIMAIVPELRLNRHQGWISIINREHHHQKSIFHHRSRAEFNPKFLKDERL